MYYGKKKPLHSELQVKDLKNSIFMENHNHEDNQDNLENSNSFFDNEELRFMEESLEQQHVTLDLKKVKVNKKVNVTKQVVTKPVSWKDGYLYLKWLQDFCTKNTDFISKGTFTFIKVKVTFPFDYDGLLDSDVPLLIFLKSRIKKHAAYGIKK
jgi:hypothetical protein